MRVTVAMPPEAAGQIYQQMNSLIDQMIANGQQPVVLCSTQIRLGLRRFFSANFPEIAFVAYEELPPKISLQSIASIPGLP